MLNSETFETYLGSKNLRILITLLISHCRNNLKPPPTYNVIVIYILRKH